MILPEVDLRFAHAKQQTTSNQILHQHHHHRHHHHHPRGRRRFHRCHASLRSSDVPSAIVRRRSAAAGRSKVRWSQGKTLLLRTALPAINWINLKQKRFICAQFRMTLVRNSVAESSSTWLQALHSLAHLEIDSLTHLGNSLTYAPGNRLTCAPSWRCLPCVPPYRGLHSYRKLQGNYAITQCKKKVLRATCLPRQLEGFYLVALDARRATTPLGFISCCT